VYCGPNIHRSSEYYQVKALNDKKIYSLATIEQWRSECLNKIHHLNFTNENRTVEQSNLMSYDIMKNHALKLLEKILKSEKNSI
jgi:hypothetical protein